jgi:sialate O-acetylesterase
MKIKVVTIFLLFHTISSFSLVKPAKIFSDNMVLQRETAIPIWGTAIPGEQIVVRLDSAKVSTVANRDGHWMVNLPRFSAGGSYNLKIEGNTDKIEFKNVLIGDVWFASGQSNMEHPMKGWEWIPHSAVDHSEEEIADSNYPEIRLFSVPKYPSPVELKYLPEGKWEVANPESVAGFSSTAWFFGKELYQKLKIPIGIISCSWGGTSIQTWMSRESLEHFKDSVILPVVPVSFDQKEWSEKVTESIEKNRLRRTRISYPKIGLPEEIANAEFNDLSWKSVDLLGGSDHFGNVVWLRKKIIVPEIFAQQLLKLSLGFLNRQSQVFINGTELGYFQYPKPVAVEIPRDLVRSGENILTIRLAQPWGDAQVLGSKEQFFITNSDRSFFSNIFKDWKANNRLEPIIPVVESCQNNLTFLFNGMVAHMIPYGIKGFIWYQGESDAEQPFLYEQMFQQLITDWRKLWKQGDLPFLFVQTSNIELSHEFDKKAASWCLLREAQQKALSLPQTGMAVSVDIGDPYDVHPKNKQDFGHRLALQAFKIAYHQDIIADGPICESYEIKGDTIVVRIKDSTSKLKVENNRDLSSFEIAGKDGVFQEAKALIKDNEIYVFSASVKNPINVRYSWSNNPRCSLFNEVGLPMAPFRTGNF